MILVSEFISRFKINLTLHQSDNYLSSFADAMLEKVWLRSTKFTIIVTLNLTELCYHLLKIFNLLFCLFDLYREWGDNRKVLLLEKSPKWMVDYTERLCTCNTCWGIFLPQVYKTGELKIWSFKRREGTIFKMYCQRAGKLEWKKFRILN